MNTCDGCGKQGPKSEIDYEPVWERILCERCCIKAELDDTKAYRNRTMKWLEETKLKDIREMDLLIEKLERELER